MKNAIQHLLRPPIAFQRAFVDITGDVICALYLSQLVYWSDVYGGKPFYITDQGISEQTGLSFKQVRRAKMLLKSLGFIKTTVAGLPARTFYEIDFDKITSELMKLPEYKRSETEVGCITPQFDAPKINEKTPPLDHKNTDNTQINADYDDFSPQPISNIPPPETTPYNPNTTQSSSLTKMDKPLYPERDKPVYTKTDKLDYTKRDKHINIYTKTNTKTNTKNIDIYINNNNNKLLLSKSQNEAELIDYVINRWNEFAREHGLSVVKLITEKRKRHLKTRLKEKEFNIDLILDKVRKSKFLLGLVHSWRVDFDFIIKSKDNYIKILEGKYDDVNTGEGRYKNFDNDINDLLKKINGGNYE